MMDGRRSHRATQYGDLPGSVARVFAGGDGGHGRREREAGRGGESLGGSSEAQRVGIPPSPEELAEVASRTAMAAPPPRGWTVERSVLTEGVQEKLQLQFWQRGEFAHRRMGKEGQRISHHRRRGSTAGDGHGRRESGGCIVFDWYGFWTGKKS